MTFVSAPHRSIAALAAATSLALSPAIPAGDARATFHGDTARTGVYAATGPRSAPATKWRFKTPGPIVGSPVIADGVVYIASLGATLHAIDAATGKEKWSFKSRLPIASTPAVAGGTVYFVSSAGSLAALDAASGSPKWVCAVEHERRFEAKGLHGYPSAAQTIPDAWDVFTSSPAVADGRVYFGSGDGGIYAVDAATGVILWKRTTGDVVHASPAVADGVVYAGSWDGVFYALDAASGAVRWTFAAGQDPVAHNQVGFQGSAAVVDGTVYVGCRDAHVYALDARTGARKWDYPTNKSWVIGTPAVRDGLVWVGTSDSSRLMALDAKTGRLRFNVDVKAYMFSSPALAGDRVYAGAHNGRLSAVDTTTGSLAWEFQTDAARADPQDVLHDDGRFDRAKFAPLFGDFQDMYLDFARFVSVGGIVSSPALDGGVLYVGSLDGTLYALQ